MYFSDFWIETVCTIKGTINRERIRRIDAIHPNVECTWSNSSTTRNLIFYGPVGHTDHRNCPCPGNLECAREARRASPRMENPFENYSSSIENSLTRLCALIMGRGAAAAAAAARRRKGGFAGIGSTYALRVRCLQGQDICRKPEVCSEIDISRARIYAFTFFLRVVKIFIHKYAPNLSNVLGRTRKGKACRRSRSSRRAFKSCPRLTRITLTR